MDVSAWLFRHLLFLSVLYACIFYFCICTCSGQLSMFHMEKRSRNTLLLLFILLSVKKCYSSKKWREVIYFKYIYFKLYQYLVRHMPLYSFILWIRNCTLFHETVVCLFVTSSLLSGCTFFFILMTMNIIWIYVMSCVCPAVCPAVLHGKNL